jgi:AraC family ethanolamine operon transcriptional activator
MRKREAEPPDERFESDLSCWAKTLAKRGIVSQCFVCCTMALIDLLTESSVLSIRRFPDVDGFRSIEQLAEARSIPLDVRNFASAFATVTLKSCSIFLQRTFPRILQARYRSDGVMVAFAMQRIDAMMLNGSAIRNPTLLLVSGSTLCDLVEPQPNLVAFVNFDMLGDRGWPIVPGSAQLIGIDPQALLALQSITRDILLFASSEPERFPEAADAMEESMLEAIDNIFLFEEWTLIARRPNLSGYLALVRKLDDLLAQSAERAVYSADIARQLGVSVRTLHNAVVAIRGMSLHRYSRLRRLWNARRQLVLGSRAARIKVVALANGFWHMGEFARHYRAAFGETPQQTQQRYC